MIRRNQDLIESWKFSQGIESDIIVGAIFDDEEWGTYVVFVQLARCKARVRLFVTGTKIGALSLF